MTHRLTRVLLLLTAALALTTLWPGGAGVSAQTTAYRPSRLADGRPDLNGIWQALNEANFDLESHGARPAMALRAGPAGPVPAAPVETN